MSVIGIIIIPDVYKRQEYDQVTPNNLIKILDLFCLWKKAPHTPIVPGGECSPFAIRLDDENKAGNGDRLKVWSAYPV